jgi:integrase/recombinase XerD
VSELTGLCSHDIQLGSGPHVRCTGKGRKDRATPLTAHTMKVLREWMKERAASPADPLFVTSRGGPLSTGAVQWLVAKYAVTAAKQCPSIAAKTVSPHALRHYVDGRVMWPAGVSRLVAELRVLVPAT